MYEKKNYIHKGLELGWSVREGGWINEQKACGISLLAVKT